ncbi:glycosyltransferase family 2 protein [Maribacter sp. ANRC-HE7]|uniref:Glycosyltransferase family 2 protein n=1 Tax=Maribacter aquimaris TaxID=2737171 RepID=A0ABR7V1A1_9FLAO|nr:glycosyltransferase family 2 protein [Maribacter aquimaris]MBD0778090.1 glycosyltransferase family 2 protein [Maribacter aquimaris]
MERHLISIITPVHNSAQFIEATIETVLKQTYSHWEMILIDDCSEDGSVAIIEKLAKKDRRFKLIKNLEKSGAGIARNKGISVAKGTFITFLDSDDLWFPNFLATSLNTCLVNNYEFVFSSYERRDEGLNSLISDFIVPQKVTYKDVLKSCPILCSSTFIDIRRIGKHYMPDLKKRQDWCFFLSVLKEVEYAYGIIEPMVIYRMRKDSISRNKLKLIPYVWKVYRDVEKLSFVRSFYLLYLWSLNGFKKYYVNTRIVEK